MMRALTQPGGRSFLVPEVVQTSKLDCGPAALKCLLEGFGIPASYGRLREACQTDLDGTSIDTMEDVATRLGLDAEQILLPLDHLLMPSAQALPAILVVRLPNSTAHFVVAWRRHGAFVQLMDPASGRRWPHEEQLLREVYIHAMNIEGETWRGWAGSPEFMGCLQTHIERLGMTTADARQHIEAALAQPGWRPIAELDAATRMMHDLLRSGGIRKGPDALRLLGSTLMHVRDAEAPLEVIPHLYWSARPAPSGPSGEEQVTVRGVVLIRIRGVKKVEETAPALSRELDAALRAPPEQPLRQLWRLLRTDGHFTPGPLLLGMVFVALAMVLEALLFRSVFELTGTLALPWQRVSGLSLFALLVLGILLIELPTAWKVRQLGRTLELGLRIEFLRKLPSLGDRYFQSRLSSDMAHRSHDINRLRLLPELGDRAVRLLLELVVTTAGLLFLVPATAFPMMALCLTMMLLPVVTSPVLSQADMRMRTHNGALARIFLDSLLGLVTIKTHSAERAIRREHEGLLVHWMEAGLLFHDAVALFEGLCTFTGFGLAAWILFRQPAGSWETGTTLLVVYWLLNLPALGRELNTVALEYPAQRNTTLRLLEPLGAPAAPDAKQLLPPADTTASSSEAVQGMSIELRDVSVSVSGHPLLEELHLSIERGEHIAIVGPSGAGKSTLAGLLLGWHHASSGTVHAEGKPLEGARIEWLRQNVAWVDPAAQLWNRSMLDNLVYGAPDSGAAFRQEALSQADLLGVLEALPEGLQTPLGEGGGLVSGGEGQRLRLGRAMHRPRARLVILDEPFRGLDRERRRTMLARARAFWKDATLLCITHDVQETQAFSRVLVIEDKRIVEEGHPQELARPGTRYQALLDAEQVARESLWGGEGWRRIWLEGGRDVPQKREKAG